MTDNDADKVSRTDCTPWRDAETVRHFYINRGYSLKEVGETVGCAECTVLQWCRKHDIETRDPVEARDDGTPDALKDEARLRELYLTLELTCQEIADEYGVTGGTVSQWLRRHDIPTRPSHGLRDRETLECENCGDTFEVIQSRADESAYCSRECYYDGMDMPTGEDHWSYNSVELTCDVCSEDFTVAQSNADGARFCSKECLYNSDAYLSGEDHPSWRDTPEHRPNGAEWDRLREECRERDNRRCQICGGTGDKEQALDVHHIIPVRHFENGHDAHTLDNVVALCRSCHRKWEKHTPFLPCTVPV